MSMEIKGEKLKLSDAPATRTVGALDAIRLEYERQEHSELTGLAFSPDGRRLYVSSLRRSIGTKKDGVVFEVRRGG